MLGYQRELRSRPAWPALRERQRVEGGATLASFPSTFCATISPCANPFPRRELLTPETESTTPAGLSPWQALKWLIYTLLTGCVGAAAWIAQNQLSEKPSAAVTSILKSHRILSVAVIPGFPLLCAGLWLFANRKEALEKIVETGLVFGH